MHLFGVNNPSGACLVPPSLHDNKYAQFAVLLALFLRPLLVRHQDTQSGGVVYRKVVIRNVVCTGAISIAYVVTAVVEVISLLHESAEDDEVGYNIPGTRYTV